MEIFGKGVRRYASASTSKLWKCAMSSLTGKEPTVLDQTRADACLHTLDEHVSYLRVERE